MDSNLITPLAFILIGVILIISGLYSLKKRKFRGNWLHGLRIIKEEDDPDTFFFTVFTEFLIGFILIGMGIIILIVNPQ